MSLFALDAGTVWAVAIPVLVLLAGVVVFAAARRRDTAAVGVLDRATRQNRDVLLRDRPGGGAASPGARELERAAREDWRRPAPTAGRLAPTAPSEPPVAYVPPDAETLGVTRRQFFNRSIVGLMGLGLAGFGSSTLAFLWPSGSGGFGAKIKVGRLADIRAKIADGNGFAYYPEGRMWITEYPEASLDKARAVYEPAALVAMEAGLSVMYQKCPHLGCRVPECVTSQWFECPCHGSQYNRVGEKKGGPAPRGLDRFATEVSGDVLTVDTGAIIQGPAIGTNTTGQEAEGPHCVSAGGE
ncbi:MAG: ubiquinol-cytochrome c reductase iron-sulfur subunit [Acidimicrobiales bacterium]